MALPILVLSSVSGPLASKKQVATQLSRFCLMPRLQLQALLITPGTGPMDDTLQIVASLAGKFGPYLFAVLVTLFVVKPALVAYIESTKGDFDRKTTQSSAKLWIFVGSSVVAIVLILSGSIWWWKHATRNMVIFTGRIVAVEDQIRILSTDLFILDTSMKLSPFISQSSDANNPSQDEMGESTLIREVSFATWNEKPFSDTKTFHLYLVKPDDPTHDRRPVVIEYTTDDEPVYEIVTRKGKYYLERFYPKTGRDSVRMEWDRFATIFQDLWLDATYVKVREAGRIVSVAVTVAVAVNDQGPGHGDRRV